MKKILLFVFVLGLSQTHAQNIPLQNNIEKHFSEVSLKMIDSPDAIKNALQKQNHNIFRKQEAEKYKAVGLKLVLDSVERYTYLDYGPNSIWDKKFTLYPVIDAVNNTLNELDIGKLPSTKEVYTYDSNGNIKEVVFKGNESGVLVDESKKEYTYDANANLIEYKEMFWNGSQWVGELKEVFIFNTNNQNTEYYQYQWDGVGWVNQYKELNSFNTQGNLYEIKHYLWLQNQWEYYYNKAYAYNGAGLLIEAIHSTISIYNSQSSLQEKYTYSYNASGDLYLTQIYFWHPNEMQWYNIFKMEYIYDANENPLTFTSFVYDREEAAWIGDWKTIYTYDMSHTMEQVADGNKNWTACDMSHKITNVPLQKVNFKWDRNNNQWTYRDKENYYYSQQNVGVDESVKNELAVYPNPASDKVYFSWANAKPELKLSIHDMLGRTVWEQTIENNKAVSLGDLPRGAYIYTLKADDWVKKGKLSLE